jgi:MFS family permease
MTIAALLWAASSLGTAFAPNMAVVNIFRVCGGIGVGVAMLAISQSARSADRARPKRYPNVTSIATLISSGWLLLLELLIAGGAADRLLNRTPARRSPVDLVGEQRCVKTGVTPAWRYQPGRRG